MTPTCPYCTAPSTFLPSSESVYGTDYGPLYRCQPCMVPTRNTRALVRAEVGWDY